MIYTIFDTTDMNNRKMIFSSNNIKDIYSKVKAFLEIDINYDKFVSQYKMKLSGWYIYKSDKNLKSVMVLIS